MNILKVIISFIIISYVAAINVAIASTPKQKPSDVKVQSEQNNKPIDSSPKKEQQLLDEKTNTIVEKQQTETTSKSNEIPKNQTDNLLNLNGEIKAIVKIEDTKKESLWKNPALWAVIGSVSTGILTGLVNLVFEIIRQKHTEKMQEKRCLPYNQIFKASMLTLLCKFLHDGFS